MNTLLPSLSVLLKKSKRSLMYGSMAAITIGLEELFENVVFNCPCDGHFAYGLVFLWAPAVLLFLSGILLDRTLWRYPRTNDKEESQTPVYLYFKILFGTLDVFIRAGIAPVAWLVVSFLQQRYYTCAYFGPPFDRAARVTNTRDKCYPKLGTRSEKLEDIYKTRSQMAGWTLMMITVSIVFTSICIRRCIKKRNHIRLPSLEYYHHVEAKEALEQFHAKAKQLAKEKAKREIYSLFKNVASKDIDARLKDVGARVEKKYEQFFVIPPESPSYGSHEITAGDPPQFPTPPSIPPELLSDGFDVESFEEHHSARVVGLQFPSQTYSAPQNPKQLARIRLWKDSYDAS